MPQRIVPSERADGVIQLRAARPVRGRVVLRTVPPARSITLDTLPERRILMPLSAVPADATGEAEIAIEPAGRAAP